MSDEKFFQFQMTTETTDKKKYNDNLHFYIKLSSQQYIYIVCTMYISGDKNHISICKGNLLEHMY